MEYESKREISYKNDVLIFHQMENEIEKKTNAIEDLILNTHSMLSDVQKLLEMSFDNKNQIKAISIVETCHKEAENESKSDLEKGKKGC